MDIYFQTRQLEKMCNDFKQAKKKLGEENAIKLNQRLSELLAAENLGVISHVPPPRLHSIEGIRGQNMYGLDLKHPFRLVIKIGNNPVPVDDKGNIDKRKVTSIIVCNVEDYHGKK